MPKKSLRIAQILGLLFELVIFSYGVYASKGFAIIVGMVGSLIIVISMAVGEY